MQTTSTKKINDLENLGTDNKCVVQNWFKAFKESDTNFKDKPR